jgi:predicted peroxiredoxin
MKTITFLSFLAIIIFSSCQNPPAANNESANAADTIRDGVFIHITQGYDDPHRLLMPLKMATMMAQDKDVIVYMDIHAVNVLVKGSKDIEFADFESAHTYIKKLVDMNVGVYACPTCLKIAGFKPEDLIDGVQIAQKDKFFTFTKGRILTLDY